MVDRNIKRIIRPGTDGLNKRSVPTTTAKKTWNNWYDTKKDG